jgi:hypothetical protein
MPPAERERLLTLIESEAWATEEEARLGRAARRDGYAAALLYALHGSEDHLEVARLWLLKFADKGGDIPMAKAKLDDPGFFTGGQPWLSPVYYNLDIRPLLAYDWVHSGLSAGDRRTIESGIKTSARFRMRSMDRWTQTANLVLKPTFMVAVAGLVTQDQELLDWGFRRKPGSVIGGYFPVLDVMLDAEGPWKEAPRYAVGHRSLELMGEMSRLLKLYDGKERFAMPALGGGSPRALMDYYIDTAYPAETGTDGQQRIRVLSYGDGATGPKGDLFLVGAAARVKGKGKGDQSLTPALAASWGASLDPRYTAFLTHEDVYQASLPDRPPIPSDVAMPAAPSRVWKDFGLAFLRSDESPGYWNNPRAMAASLMMSRGYGHDHRDKFGITFFGAGQLLYPDWNHEQYENAAIGWTRNTIAHNTLMVDEQDARNAPIAELNSDFSSKAKRVSVSASGVFEGVTQARTLILTDRYLLDVLSASSAWPRTYDWLLHGLGSLDDEEEGDFTSAPRLGPRFARMSQRESGITDQAWRRGFVTSTGGVRVTMAASAGTQVVSGTGHDGNPMLVVRRAATNSTAFVAVHEPYREGDAAVVEAVDVVATAPGELRVRVSGDGWVEEHVVPVVVAAGETPGDPARLALTAPDLRLFARDRRRLTLTLANGSSAAQGGVIEIELPPGFAMDPAVIPVGTVPPSGQLTVSAELTSRDAAPGKRTLMARFIPEGRFGVAAEAAVVVWLGPTMHSDYASPSVPLYRVEAPSMRVGLDMRHGMIRHLSDSDGRDVLGGQPLFTFAADGKPLLSDATQKSFTWPTTAPAALLAEVENAARYTVRFAGDRFVVAMDRGWTRAGRVAFTVPGGWDVEGEARWAEVARAQGKVAAAELAFPSGEWSLCFALTPAQQVDFDGAGMRFEINALAGDRWSAGFCRPGALEAWSGVKP